MVRDYDAWDFGIEEHADPEPESTYADDDDCTHVGPYTWVWCDECRRNTLHGDFWMCEDNPARVGWGCTTCRRLEPGR